MKKIFVYMASAALVFAASCNKIEEANTPVDTPAETELITVELNPQTKTSLKDMSTVWTEDDAVSVTANGEQIGTLTLVSGSTFEGTITAGLDGETVVTLNYPAGVTEVPATQEAKAGSFANGAALLEGTTTVADLRKGNAAQLSNKTALLKFVMPENGEITFYNGKTKLVSLTGCSAGNTYYACVAPNTYDLTYSVNTMESEKQKTATFDENKIYDLGTLPKFLRLLPNGTWNISNPRYAAYFFTNTEVWKDMKSHTEGLYYVEIPEGQEDVIFCRMNPSASANNWDNKWNQSANLKVKGNEGKVFVVKTVSSWDQEGSWYSISDFSSDNLYLLPENKWASSGARFAAYFFGNGGDSWTSMTSDNKCLYTVAISEASGKPNVIFCRMNPSASANNWDNKWNQSADLTIKDNEGRVYVVSTNNGSVWDKCELSKWVTIK